MTTWFTALVVRMQAGIALRARTILSQTLDIHKYIAFNDCWTYESQEGGRPGTPGIQVAFMLVRLSIMRLATASARALSGDAGHLRIAASRRTKGPRLLAGSDKVGSLGREAWYHR